MTRAGYWWLARYFVAFSEALVVFLLLLGVFGSIVLIKKKSRPWRRGYIEVLMSIFASFWYRWILTFYVTLKHWFQYLKSKIVRLYFKVTFLYNSLGRWLAWLGKREISQQDFAVSPAPTSRRLHPLTTIKPSVFIIIYFERVASWNSKDMGPVYFCRTNAVAKKRNRRPKKLRHDRRKT